MQVNAFTAAPKRDVGDFNSDAPKNKTAQPSTVPGIILVTPLDILSNEFNQSETFSIAPASRICKGYPVLMLHYSNIATEAKSIHDSILQYWVDGCIILVLSKDLFPALQLEDQRVAIARFVQLAGRNTHTIDCWIHSELVTHSAVKIGSSLPDVSVHDLLEISNKMYDIMAARNDVNLTKPKSPAELFPIMVSQCANYVEQLLRALLRQVLSNVPPSRIHFALIAYFRPAYSSIDEIAKQFDLARAELVPALQQKQIDIAGIKLAEGSVVLIFDSDMVSYWRMRALFQSGDLHRLSLFQTQLELRELCLATERHLKQKVVAQWKRGSLENRIEETVPKKAAEHLRHLVQGSSIERSAISALYEKEEIDKVSLSFVQPNQHTLLDKLTAYVENKTKFMESALEEALAGNKTIAVVGVLKEHFSEYCDSRKYQIDSASVARSEERQQKLVKMYPNDPIHKFFNVERPFHCWVTPGTGTEKEKELLIVVVPGRDYIRHTAELVNAKLISLAVKRANSLFAAKQTVAKLLRVIVHPDACDSIMKSMQLKETLGDRANGAVVIMGYSEQFCSLIEARDEWRRVADHKLTDPVPSEEFFRYRVLERSNVRVLFLSMRHTFWGDISYFLVKELLSLGAKCILYGAKLGTLRHPNAVADPLFVPSTFAYVEGHSSRVVPLKTVSSCLGDDSFPNRGSHVSIPTIMMETKDRIDYLTQHDNFGSIDNEIGQMARAVQEWNNTHPPTEHAQFGAVHFATDFLNMWQNTPQHDKSMLNFTGDDLWKLKQKQAEIIWQCLKRFGQESRGAPVIPPIPLQPVAKNQPEPAQQQVVSLISPRLSRSEDKQPSTTVLNTSGSEAQSSMVQMSNHLQVTRTVFIDGVEYEVCFRKATGYPKKWWARFRGTANSLDLKWVFFYLVDCEIHTYEETDLLLELYGDTETLRQFYIRAKLSNGRVSVFEQKPLNC